MRYIRIQELQVTQDWLDRAEDLKRQLNAAPTSAQRSEIIDANPIWRDLFVPLSNLSKGKCWYSEAKEVMSDRAHYWTFLKKGGESPIFVFATT